MRLFRPWSVLWRLYPEAVFRIKTSEKMISLTFDDGPDPESTPAILEILQRYNVKAAFFCTGIRAEAYPELITRIKSSGHITGNHGYSHLNGWKTSVNDYVSDTFRAAGLTSGTLFRPPYGRLTFKQYNELKRRYKIVFWDLMSYDFDPAFGSTCSLNLLKSMMRPGSVIVLHDKPGSCAPHILEDFLKFASAGQYRFINTF